MKSEFMQQGQDLCNEVCGDIQANVARSGLMPLGLA